MSDFSPEELSQQAASVVPEWRERKALDDFTQTLSSLNRVSQTILAMKPQLFEHFKKSVCSCETSPKKLSEQLLEFGNPLVTASQAKSLLDLLRARGEEDYKYYHVLCSRVVDPWNLNQSDHSIGHCYYGYANVSDKHDQQSLAKLIGSTEKETVAALFWRLLRNRLSFNSDGLPEWSKGLDGAFLSEHFWSEQDLKFIRDEMLEQGIAQALDVVITCQPSGSGYGGYSSAEHVLCTTVAGDTFGCFRVPSGEAPFGPWLSAAASTQAPRELGSRLCLAKQSGEVFWQEDMPSIFDATCKRLKDAPFN